jgi:hypothetical protein
MPGIVERIGSLAGTELAKAADLAHSVFQERLNTHGHTGRAVIETIAEICRNHPNLVGIGVGLLVEQILLEEKRRYEAHHPKGGVLPAPAPGHEAHPGAEHEPPLADPNRPLHESIVPDTAVVPAHPVHPVKPHKPLKPGSLAFEVFGGLLVLKMGALGSAIFRKDHHAATWLADVSKIHIFSATFAAYYTAKAIRSHKISAWRNAAIALFATDAIKPMLQMDPKRRKALAAAQRH